MVPHAPDIQQELQALNALTSIPGGAGLPSLGDVRALGNVASQVPAGLKAMGSDVLNTVTHPVEQFRQKPIGTALNAASVAAPFLMPEAKTVQGALEEGATRASRLAQEQSIKSLEGAIGQVRQLGPEEARAVGQLALDKGIVSPFTPTSLGMERTLQGELGKSGETIGALRQAGDVAGGAPEASLLKNNIAAELTPKYETGMRSGEMGSLKHALEEVGKIEKPSFVANAEKATEMNQYAAGNKMLQPTGAFTDVANTLSRTNNEALQKALTPEQWQAYQSALNDFSGLKAIEKFFSRGEVRELAGRGSGLLTDLYKGTKDVIGHKALAAGADTFADMLSSPAVAKALPALVTAAKAGPAALDVTHSILQKNDPEYAEQTKDVSSQASNVTNSPESIVAHVISNPKLAPYGPMFQDANQRGPQAVIANHFTLMQRDPAYNKAFSEIGGDQRPPHFMPPIR